MNRCLIACVLSLAVIAPRYAAAHCQVPCGVYDDQRRFEEMLEDTETIAKAITAIGELAATHDATGHNQLVRWVTTKDSHASNIQTLVGEYFLAQRIKSDSPRYVDQLKAAHTVIVAAMKTKQAADPKTATDLEEAIKDLYRAYEGKEPVAIASPAVTVVVAARLGGTAAASVPGAADHGTADHSAADHSAADHSADAHSADGHTHE